MIRWYIVQDREIVGEIDAPDKRTADALAHKRGVGIGVVSVLEYEEIEREIAAEATRAKRARQIARDAEQMAYIIDEDQTREKTMDAHYAACRAWRGSQLYRALKGEIQKVSDGFNEEAA